MTNKGIVNLNCSIVCLAILFCGNHLDGHETCLFIVAFLYFISNIPKN